MTTGAAELPPGQAVGTETSRRRAFLFGKSARIASRRRFEELYASDTKRVGRYLVAWHAPSETASHRLGVTAAKRTFHDAWQRNRAKRLLRESFRRLRPSFAGGPWDLVLVAKRRILEAREPAVRADLEKVGGRGRGGPPPRRTGRAVRRSDGLTVSRPGHPR